MAKKTTSFLHDPRTRVDRTGKFKLQNFHTDIDSLLVKKDPEGAAWVGPGGDRRPAGRALSRTPTASSAPFFQAMDAAGKDSCIRHVMSGVNPQGVIVNSFKAPSSLERSHDFLWRHHAAIPPKGFIGIHNRSHYEEVLVTKVHPAIILGQKLPGISSAKDISKKFWNQRYAAIRAFEEHLATSGVIIMKFFLHMSRDQQKQRFLERIDDPNKNWKFSANDVKERTYWKDYMAAYEDAIRERPRRTRPGSSSPPTTSGKAAHWWVVCCANSCRRSG